MKFFLWACLVLIITIILSIIPFHQKKDLLIKARYENVFSQLLRPMNWKNWQPDVKSVWQHDSTKVYTTNRGAISIIEAQNLRIETKLNGFGLDVEKNTKWANEHYSFSVVTNQNHRYTDIHVITNTCGYKWLMALLTQKSLFADLQALKQYMEDEKAYYGYNIHTYNAVDTIVMVEQRTVSIGNRNSAIAEIRQELQAFINKNRLKITQPIMADIRALYQDSIRIMVGFSVNKAVNPEGRIHIMRIPKQAKMLSVTYEGKYGSRQAAYSVLRSYMRDHDLLAPEIPYEKYFDNKIPNSDTAKVYMQIIAPLQ